MCRFARCWKVIGFAFGGAVAASFIVWLVAASAFAFPFTEPVGRVVGVVGTIAGISGAVVGLRIGLCATAEAAMKDSKPTP